MVEMFICERCHKTFTRKDNLEGHIQRYDNAGHFRTCSYCNKSFTRAHDSSSHIKRIHERKQLRTSSTFEIVSEDNKTTKKVQFGN